MLTCLAMVLLQHTVRFFLCGSKDDNMLALIKTHFSLRILIRDATLHRHLSHLPLIQVILDGLCCIVRIHIFCVLSSEHLGLNVLELLLEHVLVCQFLVNAGLNVRSTWPTDPRCIDGTSVVCLAVLYEVVAGRCGLIR